MSVIETQTIATGSPIEVLAWDDGRLLVNAAFADWLDELGLNTAQSLLELDRGEVYRAVGERITARHEFTTSAGTRAVYTKRHGVLTWRERFKSLCRLQQPVWGARPEWNAIVEFHRLGIPTMTPIACAEFDGRSCLMTASLEDCTRLDHWFAESASSSNDRPTRRALVERLARITRQMHRAGWHHQDLYLCHVLWPAERNPEQLHIIDLGRVQPHSRWGAGRWIVKDLAQLQFSAQALTAAEQMRFLREYLGRKLTPSDRRLVRRLLWKSARISRHTRRHGL